MLDIKTTALLRAIHAEVCENIFGYEIYTRTHVASKLLESASSGERSIHDLKKIGRNALKQAAGRSCAELGVRAVQEAYTNATAAAGKTSTI